MVGLNSPGQGILDLVYRLSPHSYIWATLSFVWYLLGAITKIQNEGKLRLELIISNMLLNGNLIRSSPL